MNQSQVPGSASSYRGLLTLVILLGMLIMLGVGALIGAAYVNASRPQEPRAPENAASLAIAASPYLANLAAPGQRIESAEMRDNKILVRLIGPRGDELVVLDATTGRVIGRVVLGIVP